MPAESRFRLERQFDIGVAFRSGAMFELPPARDQRRARIRVAGSPGRNSLLPSWCPRTPLQDITATTAVIKRRRARLGEENGESTGNLAPSHQVHAPPEHEITATPSTIKKRPGPLHKILLEVANQPDEGEPLTPQKLLNSIEKVEKVVMEELQRLKRTTTAKMAEREKSVRTLMSMR